MRQRCLMLGAGTSRVARCIFAPTSAPEEETEWVTLDHYVPADIDFNLWDLETGSDLPGGPYDEIHAYEVLEHFGTQGDFMGLFRTFNALHRALKPGGYLIGSSPSWNGFWAWQDPGHCRIIGPGVLSFLEKKHYDQLGKTTSSDYRSFIDPHWWSLEHSELSDNEYFFALRKC